MKSVLDLTKWPRLLVTGNPVTPEQANTILIRTACLHLAMNTNDEDWNRQVATAFGVTTKEPSYNEPDINKRIAACRAHSDEIRRIGKELGTLRLSYLGNQRIGSTWIGGPHGWCDWSGNIGSNTWNIGKWPTSEEVTEDWKTVAAAFPYLTLDAQVIPDEGEDAVAAQWHVENGSAEQVEVGKRLEEPGEVSPEEFAMSFIFNSDRERGVPLERLVEAVAQVRAEQAGTVNT